MTHFGGHLQDYVQQQLVGVALEGRTPGPAGRVGRRLAPSTLTLKRAETMLQSMFLLVFTFVLVKLFFPDLGGEVERLLMGAIETLKHVIGGTLV